MEHNKDINIEDLKKYAKYLIDALIDVYKKAGGDYEDSGLYHRLNQFCKEGRIKDLISRNDKTDVKINILNILRGKIIGFNNDFEIGIDLDTFEDFLLNQYSPDEYKMKKDTKKYNL